MMYSFLTNNRNELVERCKEKVSMRPKRAATAEQLQNGIPLFLDQLTRTLRAEELGESDASLLISGPAGGTAHAQTEMGVSAAAHGKALLSLGFTVDQVVHDYGDLCQAITDLAQERDAPFEIDEFRTLNRCLDNAIADAVTEFSFQHDALIERHRTRESNERLGVLVHELRNVLGTAHLAFSALELGSLPCNGATGAVLKRSLAALAALISQSIEEVRDTAAATQRELSCSVARLIADATEAGDLAAHAKGCRLVASAVDPLLGIQVNYELLLAALANLLNNAFKFTHPGTEVRLTAFAAGDRVLIEVADCCGGLPAGSPEKMFTPFFQRSQDRSGVGCVFTISLPRYTISAADE
jgi:signal transduction histidine kinase